MGGVLFVARAKTMSFEGFEPDPRALDRAVSVLRAGGVLSFPTETFYGLGADGRSRSACERIFELKGRDEAKALPCIVAGISQMEEAAFRLTPGALLLARHFWPGPLTLVVRARPGLAAAFPEGTIALRASGLPSARRLAEALGGPVTATSANRSGRAPLTTAEEVLRELGEEIDLLLDGGPCPGGLPSTIVDVTGSTPVLVRPGRVPFEEVERVLSRASSS